MHLQLHLYNLKWHTMIETINALLFCQFQGLLACKLYEFSGPLLQWSAQVPAAKQSTMYLGFGLTLKKFYSLKFNSHDETLVTTIIGLIQSFMHL